MQPIRASSSTEISCMSKHKSDHGYALTSFIFIPGCRNFFGDNLCTINHLYPELQNSHTELVGTVNSLCETHYEKASFVLADLKKLLAHLSRFHVLKNNNFSGKLRNRHLPNKPKARIRFNSPQPCTQHNH